MNIFARRDSAVSSDQNLISSRWPIPQDRQHVFHDDVMKWKHFPRYWPFVRRIHRSPVNSPHKGQWRGALMFFYLRLNKRLSKQSWGWWFETPSRPLWRHRNVTKIYVNIDPNDNRGSIYHNIKAWDDTKWVVMAAGRRCSHILQNKMDLVYISRGPYSPKCSQEVPQRWKDEILDCKN